MKTFVELETVAIRHHGHSEYKRGRFGITHEIWIAEPVTVEINGKLLLPLDEIESVRREEHAAYIRTKGRDMIQVSHRSYDVLRIQLGI